MKNLKTIPALVLSGGLLLAACSKEKPESPASEQAATINQANGVTETVQRAPNGANVVFSNWITKTEADWTGFGTSEIKTDINTTSLTDAIRNQGLVLVYMEHASSQVYLLPFVQLQFNQVVDYSFVTGKITVKLTITGGGQISGVTNLKFRYVLIPSSSFGNNTSGRTKKQIDYKDYNAVCEYFGTAR